ncbi:unnamed protein product [Lupinus luteus]|uniref:Cellulose synthase n=1 Tax=Lupinus luteus TaxID=3873 RepID=A0AAV1YHQ6_LUPLU
MALDSQVCQICGDNVGKTVDGEPFVACDVCAFPVCRPCYEYERKDGKQVCLQCKIRYKRHKGSPAILGDREGDGGADDGASDFNYDSEPQNQKQKIPECMLSWHMTYGRAEEVGAPNYDKEVSHNHIPRLTNRQELSGELSAASPGQLSMASPYFGGRKRAHILPYLSDVNQSSNVRAVDSGLGSVAWKERVDGWKMKQDKNVFPMNTCLPAFERGVGEIDACTDILVDDSLLSDEARQPLSRKVSIPSSKINPYRLVIVLRLIVLCIFLHYRITNPVLNAYPLWLVSVICETWFAISWILDQFPKWLPVNRETYLDRLSLRYEREGEPSQLAAVLLGQSGGLDSDGNELPRLVYVSREKRPGFQHHKKAGAMNALVRVSAVLTNGPFLLNLDCDHYINNSKALREAMCFMMDPNLGRHVCFVQFPQRFDAIDKNDRYANHNTVFFDINLRGLDGIQGPVYVGTGCVFNRTALYGYEPPVKPKHKSPGLLSSLCAGDRKKRSESSKKGSDKKKSSKHVAPTVPIYNLEDIEEGVEGTGFDDEKSLLMSQMRLEKRFGQSAVFVASTLMENGGVPQSATPETLLKEAIHVISCGYEDITEWGTEIGWIYGSVTEDILTGFKMHARGWRSIYCMPKRPAFKGSAPINLSDRLNQVLRWALGSVEILFSRHCPLWYGYGGRLKWLERFAYVNTTVYPVTSIPLLMYCTLPSVCLLTNKFIIPQISYLGSVWFISLFISIFATGILEMRWSGVGIDEWWRNEQFWVIGGVSAHLFAVFQGLLKVLAGIDTNFTVTSKASDEDGDFAELYMFKWTALLIPPSTLLIINLVGIIAGISNAINSGYQSWGPLFGKIFFAFWVIIHLYPFLKGLMGRQKRTPTIVVVWSILLASLFSLLWVRVNPFTRRITGLNVEECGINC